MQEDPTYPQRFKAARQCAAQALEDEAVRRAYEGIRRPLLHQGKQVYINGEPAFTVEYSDQLLMFLLKAWKPELYREHFSLDISKIKVEDLSDEQLEAFITRLLGEAFPNDPAAAAEARKALEEGRVVELKAEQAGDPTARA